MTTTSYYRNREQNQNKNRARREDRFGSDDDFTEESYATRNRGPVNRPNYGRAIGENNFGPGDYGYNQGRDSYSNAGGRSYGQNYGQYHEDSYRRGYSDQRNYAGRYDEHPGYWQDNTRQYWEEPEREYGVDANAYGHADRRRSLDFYNRSDHERDDYSDRYVNVYPLRQTHWDEYETDRRNDTPEYRNYGYQSSAQTEGFGQRSGHRQERDWESMDDYRGGHGQRHWGRGRYGSR